MVALLAHVSGNKTMFRFVRLAAFYDAGPEFIALLEEGHGLPAGTDIQIYRAFRFTWKRYLKMLGSEQRGNYRIGRAKLETVHHPRIGTRSAVLEGLRMRQRRIIYPHRDIRCGDFV